MAAVRDSLHFTLLMGTRGAGGVPVPGLAEVEFLATVHVNYLMRLSLAADSCPR